MLAGILGCERPVEFYDEDAQVDVLLADFLYAPHLIRPKNGGTVRLGTTSQGIVTLRWSWIPSATSYTAQVSSDTSFVNPVFSVESDTTFVRTTPLGIGTYYWRARSQKGPQVSEWVGPNRFDLVYIE